MDSGAFEEFREQLESQLDNFRLQRDRRAFELPNILGDPDYIKMLTLEYNYTDRVN